MSECVIPERGTVTKRGYVRMGGDRDRYFAHRRAWEEEHGPVPDGMVLHHVCFNKKCANVEHLRMLTQAEHLALHRMAECPKCGGPLTEYPNGGGYTARRCRPCRNARNRELRSLSRLS